MYRPINLVLIVLTLSFLACQPLDSEESEDQLLARVQNKTLYLSELDGWFPEGSHANDSLLVINNYVNRWTREMVMLNEAERNIPKNLEIDKLVRDYRASLIVHNYEKTLIAALLDSTITEVEMDTFYQTNQQQYLLEVPIVRLNLVKVTEDFADMDLVEDLWSDLDDENRASLIDFCNDNAILYHLSSNNWLSLEDIAVHLPNGTLTAQNVNRVNNLNQAQDGYRYFLKVLEVRDRGKVAPLAYVEEQARKVILHKRKLLILDEKKDEMYQLSVRKNQVEIFTDKLK